ASGARMVVWPRQPDGSVRIAGTIGGGNFEFHVIEAAWAALATGRPRRYAVHLTRDLGMCCGGAMDVFIEPIRPQDRLVIFGAGHVAKPTASLALGLGYAVTIVDERDEWANAERFPGCEIVCSDPRAYAASLPTDRRTWILLTTHAHA